MYRLIGEEEGKGPWYVSSGTTEVELGEEGEGRMDAIVGELVVGGQVECIGDEEGVWSFLRKSMDGGSHVQVRGSLHAGHDVWEERYLSDMVHLSKCGTQLR
jgi:hypothetical protein